MCVSVAAHDVTIGSSHAAAAADDDDDDGRFQVNVDRSAQRQQGVPCRLYHCCSK